MTKYMKKYEEMKQISINEGKEEYFNTMIKNECEQVERQTDYPKDIAMNKLIEHELNTLNVIKEWMGIPLIKDTPKKSPNQMIYHEFRNFLDEAAINYYKKK